MTAQINLNQNARVKLTPRGKDFYRTKMKEEPPLDEEGYYRAELWRIIEEFGGAISFGSPPPFEMTILIEGEINLKRPKIDEE